MRDRQAEAMTSREHKDDAVIIFHSKNGRCMNSGWVGGLDGMGELNVWIRMGWSVVQVLIIIQP